ncbi:MAG: polysaccharide deacetylase family protein [Gammaproteobacteria bacterium]|nr:polysaccharide deacetylase family protein [Pseudomonadales bacterium]
MRLTPLPLLCILVTTALAGGIRAAEHGVIIQYHHVATDTPASTSISPRDFQIHLEYLRENGFNVIPLDQMLEALRQQQPVPDRSIAITFDDGYLSIYETAYPLLQQFGFPFTVFVSTGPIDDNQPGFMNWEQLEEMADHGALIANHMVNHPYMLERGATESPAQWIQRLREELLSAEQAITEHTGNSLKYLAYPYGEYDPAIKAMLAAEGFTGIAQNSGAVGFHSDFLALPRYPLAGIYANLETARVKFDSLAFQVLEQDPDNPVTGDSSPTIRLRFAPGDYSFDQIGCFANSEPLPMTWLERDSGLVELRPEQQFNGRRWRYICTAPNPGTGRFFWYSVQWINPARGG